MPVVRILDEAADELEAAAAYLEQEREGYGALFLDAYEAKLRQLQRFPHSAPRIANAASHGLRAFSLRRFPYSMIVGTLRGELTIVAIAHHSREPGYWRERVK